MRNSFSLSVHFLLVQKSDVKLFSSVNLASHKMKLICLIIISLWFSHKSNCQKFSQEQFPFSPQFKSSNSPNGVFGSDKSIYLPPESHTTMPYFPMNNGNNLQFQFLPPTATKAPSIYPTPFPMVMSSTMVSRNDEDDHETVAEDTNKSRYLQFSNHLPPSFRNKNDTHTDKNIEHSQERDMRSISKNFNFQNANDRIDIKFSPQMHSVTQRTLINQTPASQRRMIISSEILKNEHGSDQIKRASILGPQSLSSPITYYSTTEPAIPILRLSNEMDLDGSFSYEALGADQTHYVQHSRMENSGTDKEEQVVEGSYSYVGDNGQTYTVHYVADSNGYRASGDHLPVPPPIPEIIQRSIQYNLAEEAKKPAHLKSWEENGKEYENGESEKHRFSILPPRNLFTGRIPEAFSFGLTQSSVLQNKIASDDSSQASSKINFDFSSDQSKAKINNGPITPQITFLASQGAHKPTVNTGHQQVQRIFATDKPTLPQVMNYEAGTSESDQENNKALWRWQYGLNTNGAVENQNSNKNSISRSFGEGDDVMINFNNMSPEQYTKIIKSDFLEQNTENSISHSKSQNKETIDMISTPLYNHPMNDNIYSAAAKQNDATEAPEIYKYSSNIPRNEHESTATDNTMVFSTASDWSKHMNNMQYNDKITNANNNFIASTPLSTQSYGYSENPYESTKLKPKNIYMTTDSTDFLYKNYDRTSDEKFNEKSVETNTENFGAHTTYPPNDFILNKKNNIKFTDFIQREDQSNFKPTVNLETEKKITQEATTTESSPESIIRNNIFLKNLFIPGNSAVDRQKGATEEPKQPYHNKVNLEPKLDKVPKLIAFQSKPQNEIHNTVKKPLDMTDVLNYITFKNHFESNKLKSKPKFSHSERLGQRLEKPQLFIPLENDTDLEDEELAQEETQNNLRTLNNQKQQELRGIIKNYKVLHRTSNTKNMGQSKDQFMTDPSQRHLKAFQTQNLPPLGRAGPSMKSYLPPTYL